MSQLINLVITAFDDEMNNYTLDDEMFSIVLEYYRKNSLYINYHSYFITRNINTIVDEVFNNPVVRDFVLNLTLKVNILLKLELGNEAFNDIYDIIQEAAMPSANTLIPKVIAEQIKPSVDVKEILKQNDWLLVLFITVVYHERSFTFKEYTSQK